MFGRCFGGELLLQREQTCHRGRFGGWQGKWVVARFYCHSPAIGLVAVMEKLITLFQIRGKFRCDGSCTAGCWPGFHRTCLQASAIETVT
jgi:hypothetical protein